MLGRVKANFGGIMLFHDTKKEIAAMLPDVLHALRPRGRKALHVVPAPR